MRRWWTLQLVSNKFCLCSSILSSTISIEFILWNIRYFCFSFHFSLLYILFSNTFLVLFWLESTTLGERNKSQRKYPLHIIYIFFSVIQPTLSLIPNKNRRRCSSSTLFSYPFYRVCEHRSKSWNNQFPSMHMISMLIWTNFILLLANST